MRLPLVTLTLIFFFLNFSGMPIDPHETAKKKPSASKKKVVKQEPSLKVMDKGKVSPHAMKVFLLQNNGEADTNAVKKLIKVYIIEANREGVNYEAAFCQMCLETGFLRFEGSVSRYQNNYCGLGCVDMFSGGDWFANMEEGVRAHIQHLKAYASLEPLRTPVVDPRFNNVQRGSVKLVTDLTGRWATDPDYGQKIAALIKRLHSV